MIAIMLTGPPEWPIRSVTRGGGARRSLLGRQACRQETPADSVPAVKWLIGRCKYSVISFRPFPLIAWEAGCGSLCRNRQHAARIRPSAAAASEEQPGVLK